MIRAAVRAGRYTNPPAEKFCADTLIARRDAIGREWLTNVNSIIDPVLEAAGVAKVPASNGAFVRVQIRAVHGAHPSWAIPVQAFFVRNGQGWKLVGFERLPDGAARITGTH